MRTLRLFVYTLLTSFILLQSIAAAADGKIKVLLVTGGHDFEEEAFFKLFKANPDITWEGVAHPNAHEKLKTGAASWDVLVLYDMYQPITEEAKKDFLGRLKEGKGLVVMHHAIANYQTWPEYANVIGARYYLEPTVVDGVEKKRSAWKHDMKFRADIATTTHPVVAGLKAFDIHDETYKWFDVYPGVTPLLTTEEPESNKVIAWAKTYESARVVYIQLGHDHFAYENPNYAKLVRQAIRWTGRKD